MKDSTANHMKDVGLMGDGFGSTPEMTRRNLIWVVAKLWFAGASVKNGIANHWLLCDANTGETIAQSNRKVSKFPEEVRGETTPVTMDYCISDDIKLSKLHNNITDFVQTGLIVMPNTLLTRQMLFAKCPTMVLKSDELFYLASEFMREYRENNEIKSLTTVVETRDNAKYQFLVSVCYFGVNFTPIVSSIILGIPRLKQSRNIG
ncbi:hypothetical protein MKW94_010352 [Papaver nudicaule]|uniref:Uncharacterized protein n=1 Tax=Papaver nudicaule TaxID=74823 RepID=A0AA41S7M0_PAPNU|nr:hypothetical protein [Papaver nudicaule]